MTTRKTTVLITTHYNEEARQSDVVRFILFINKQLFLERNFASFNLGWDTKKWSPHS